MQDYIKQAIIDARGRTAEFEKKYQRLPRFKSQRFGRSALSRKAKKAELEILQHPLPRRGAGAATSGGQRLFETGKPPRSSKIETNPGSTTTPKSPDTPKF